MKKYAFLLLLLILMPLSSAWFTPAPTSSFIASMDVLAVSSDAASVGSRANLWRNSYVRNQYLPYRAENPENVTSMGVVYAKTDGQLYFKNAAGTVTQIS